MFFQKKLTFSKVRTFQNHVFFKKSTFFKSRLFQKYVLFNIAGFSKSCDFQNHKKGWSRPLTLIMELIIINKVSSITLPPKTTFEIDRTKPFKSLVETYVFLAEQNSVLVKNGLSNNTKYKKRVGT